MNVADAFVPNYAPISKGSYILRAYVFNVVAGNIFDYGAVIGREISKFNNAMAECFAGRKNIPFPNLPPVLVSQSRPWFQNEFANDPRLPAGSECKRFPVAQVVELD